ncbi:MAG: hypothetical protein MJZ25_09135 [Fibrobacter sp.]|nr:hypothetical protein [Fibrobacter sp.]
MPTPYLNIKTFVHKIDEYNTIDGDKEINSFFAHVYVKSIERQVYNDMLITTVMYRESSNY